MRNRLVSSDELCVPLSLAFVTLAHTKPEEVTVSGWNTSEASTSGDLVAVEASVHSNRKARGKLRIPQAGGPAQQFVNPVPGPEFAVSCVGSKGDVR